MASEREISVIINARLRQTGRTFEPLAQEAIKSEAVIAQRLNNVQSKLREINTVSGLAGKSLAKSFGFVEADEGIDRLVNRIQDRFSRPIDAKGLTRLQGDIKRLENIGEQATVNVVGGLQQAGGGAFAAARGFALLAATADQDDKAFQKTLQTLFKFQAVFDLISGGTQIFKGIATAVTNYQRATLAAAAANEVLALSQGKAAAAGILGAGGQAFARGGAAVGARAAGAIAGGTSAVGIVGAAAKGAGIAGIGILLASEILSGFKLTKGLFAELGQLIGIETEKTIREKRLQAIEKEETFRARIQQVHAIRRRTESLEDFAREQRSVISARQIEATIQPRTRERLSAERRAEFQGITNEGQFKLAFGETEGQERFVDEQRRLAEIANQRADAEAKASTAVSVAENNAIEAQNRIEANEKKIADVEKGRAEFKQRVLGKVREDELVDEKTFLLIREKAVEFDEQQASLLEQRGRLIQESVQAENQLIQAKSQSRQVDIETLKTRKEILETQRQAFTEQARSGRSALRGRAEQFGELDPIQQAETLATLDKLKKKGADSLTREERERVRFAAPEELADAARRRAEQAGFPKVLEGLTLEKRTTAAEREAATKEKALIQIQNTINSRADFDAKEVANLVEESLRPMIANVEVVINRLAQFGESQVRRLEEKARLEKATGG